MPAPGEQHRLSAATINPFEETRPHVSQYTAQEIATLQSRLEKQLGPEYISSRPGAAGQKVHYLAAEKCINLANEVFGFNGWSSGIQNVQIDFVDESQSTGKISIGLSVIVRVTLRDGTFHEDVGYGHTENCKGKAAAFEKAKKEGTTDALKRALRNFGNILGNCIYDKEYLAKVTKLRIAPSKWDADNLHRHPDYAPIKKESLTQVDDIQMNGGIGFPPGDDAGDEFGSDEFDEADFGVSRGEHPDEVTLDNPLSSGELGRRSIIPKGGQSTAFRRADAQTPQQIKPSTARVETTPVAHGHDARVPSNIPPNNMAQQPRTVGIPSDRAQPNRMEQVLAVPQQINAPLLQRQALPPQAPRYAPNAAINGVLSAPQSPKNRQSPNQARGATPPADSLGVKLHEPPVGFFTARAAESLQNATTLPPNAPVFNPRLESPSIRKTAGIDHSKTKPVIRDAIGVPLPVPNSVAVSRPSVVNPGIDHTRRIGMPGMAASPLQNRNSYKPPQMKRPAEPSLNHAMRPALGDVTIASVNVPLDGLLAGGDSKRQRVGDAPGVGNSLRVNAG
ncbi:Rad52/22 double-strand break repair protein [Lasallia pustulata]|uniref:RAD52 homolog n=1 Tax=Lasallia pustulata TaxID=136370 RepID=A0A1W5DD58_9LECA|nr:Rad52/22 double-strand break repair protein [Lasallia pustulata]